MSLSVYILFSLFFLIATSAFFYKFKVIVNFIQPAILVLLGIQIAYICWFTDSGHEKLNNMRGYWETIVIMRTYLIGLLGIFMSFWYSKKLYVNYKTKYKKHNFK